MTSRSDSDRSQDQTSRSEDDGTTAADDVAGRLRRLPRIDRLLARSGDLVARYGRAAVTDELREAVAAARESIRAGGDVPPDDALVADAAAAIARRRPARLQRVVNATGVVVHTNLGRAPLADAARDALLDATGYCDLEYELASGQRGSRTARLEPLLREATGAEAAFAVNNAAAALVLALAALAAGRGVVVSRGELIEIGGSFRLPDIMAASGARLVEVGTTNRTHTADYFLGDDVGAILALHPSNYRIVGFVTQPTLPDLAAVAAKREVPLIYDAGSGLLEPASGALAGEPSVSGALHDGADVVLCSADKLLGGPQAGLLFGRRELIERCRRHPLARALRLDKLRIAALQATLELHVSERRDEVPVWRMLIADDAGLEDRCVQMTSRLREAGVAAEVARGTGLPGGGSAPDVALNGPVVRVTVDDPDLVAARLRAQRPPTVIRVAERALVVDLRTVDESDDGWLVDRLVGTIIHSGR